jgi:RNase P subunit RPR2
MGAVKCPKCGYENAEFARACFDCGEPLLDAQKETVLLDDADAWQGTIKCRKCGYPNEGNAVFCVHCGLPLIDIQNKPIGLEDTGVAIGEESMVTCPRCGRENKDDAIICAHCGEPFIFFGGGTGGGGGICPYCGHENLEDAKICADCGSPLIEFGVGLWVGPLNPPKDLVLLSVPDAEKTFTFIVDEILELVIGRRDPDTGEAPPVDLSDVGGLDKGVSRKHASIVRFDGMVHLVDRGSANGTFLNGQKLVAHQARRLCDGDEVRLGRLVMRVKFERAGART